LYVSTSVKNGVIGNAPPSRNAATIAALVSWSAANTAAASHSQRSECVRSELVAIVVRSCEGARLARAIQVRDAAGAKGRMRGILPHLRAVMPAALALRVRAGPHVDRQRLGRRHRRGGSDHHEAQVILEARERLVFGWRC